MKIYMIIIILLLLGAFFVISENKLSLRNPDDRIELGKIYFSWVAQIFQNGINLVGDAIKLEWLPENKTG